MKIITVTLNPAFDLYYTVDNFRPFRENYITSVRVNAGGKGINVSRALTVNGIRNTAYAVFGRENCDSFLRALEDDNMKLKPFFTDGRIRENITVLSDGMAETRLSFDNFYLPSEVFERLSESIYSVLENDTLLIFSGKIPRGLTKDNVMEFLHRVRQTTDYIVIDSKSFTTDELISLRPFLIKPNEQEAAEFCGADPEDESSVAGAARLLAGKGIANVLVTLGGNGAIYCRENGGKIVTSKITVPPITPMSTVGAGDSSIAGFCAAHVMGGTPDICARTALAFGTAKCLREGTLPPLPEQVLEIYRKINSTEYTG